MAERNSQLRNHNSAVETHRSSLPTKASIADRAAYPTLKDPHQTKRVQYRRRDIPASDRIADPVQLEPITSCGLWGAGEERVYIGDSIIARKAPQVPVERIRRRGTMFNHDLIGDSGRLDPSYLVDEECQQPVTEFLHPDQSVVELGCHT